MFSLTAKIIIKSEKTWTFDKISSCEIERDIENITQKCTFTLPKNTKWKGETAIPVKRGDRVSFSLGYDGDNTEVFTGYISRLTTKTPVEITCEDEMFLLKNTPAKKKTYPDADLEQMLREQLPADVKLNVFSRHTFGKYVVDCDTVSALLGELSENGFTFFFRDGTLHAGMIFDHTGQIAGPKQLFIEGGVSGAQTGNIIDDSDLVWNDAKNITLRIRASGTDRTGKKIEVEVGDDDGELRSYFKYSTTEEELKAEATKKLTEWKISGFSGSFTSFAAHPAWLLDLIKIKTNEHPEGGVYRVTKNTISYGNGGYRQEITIGGKTQ
ncbi:MAG: hypothetical protein LBJ47_09825 [Tannerella sp.]|jgi:hypothetical protein|nr:hypothetical protein [Tannerella sp.]